MEDELKSVLRYMRNLHLFLLLSSVSSLLLFLIPNFSTISLSLNCLGEGCSANADGCFSSACKTLLEKGNSRGHGSDPGSMVHPGSDPGSNPN